MAGMARVRITAKDITEGASLSEERDHLSEGEEDLSNVDADPSELMKKDRPAPTLRFGPSAMSTALIESYVERGYFPAGVYRPPQAEETPNPEDGECVVFRDFFVAGLQFPLDPAVPEILSRFKVKIHQLMPNAFVQLSKFFWAVKTFAGPVSVDTFYRLYELHPQGRKVRLCTKDEVFSAQSGCCTFVPRRPNNSLKIDRLKLSYYQKNRWDVDWTQFWFYAKVCFPSANNPVEVSYPLASKVLPVEHISQAEFRRFGVGYKDCLDAFASVAALLGGRDLIEEFVCANI